jgi:chemotaxis protein CheD
MHIRHSHKYEKEIKVIHPGEFYVSSEDEIIGTLLGSCVALCLTDLKSGIAGMNHYMLPGRISSVDIFQDKTARYGITAINMLLSTMIKNGAVKENIEAKIFGGGHVLDTNGSNAEIPNDNIKLARIMMEFEDILVTHSDVGSNYTRKLLLNVKSGKVYLKKSTREEVYNTIFSEERKFAKRTFGENGKN